MTPAEVAGGLRRWLGEGPLQAEDGAYRAWRDAGSGEMAFAYPEITGYACTWLAGRPDPTPAERGAADRAAAWLVTRLDAGEYSARADYPTAARYNFDLAMIAAGLLRHGSDASTRTGLALAARLGEQVDDLEGLGPIDPRGPAPTRAPGWSVDGRAHLLKAVQCLLLAERAGDAHAGRQADALYEASLTFMREDGRFVTEAADETVMLHPHAYALEGLYVWGTARGDAAALERARAGLAWAWRHQLPTGGFPRAVRPGGTAPDGGLVEQLDVTSQIVRMALALDVDVPRRDEAVARLCSVAVQADPGLALPYQPTAPAVHQNSWVSMFGAQALELAAGHGPLAFADVV